MEAEYGAQVTWNVFEFGKTMTAISRGNRKRTGNVERKVSKDSIDINVTDAYLELIRMEKERF